MTRCLSAPVRFAALAAGAAAGVYGVLVGRAWLGYGHPPAARDAARDALLDGFMPRYDVVERHALALAAPAGVVLRHARALDLSRAPIARAIFRARELLFRQTAGTAPPSRGLIDDMRAIGWGLLAETPDREIVMGGYTRPWEPAPVFHAVPADGFAAFDEPGVVKIVWTLRADPVDAGRSVFRTETRAVATDAVARRRFRIYWACLSPGIALIRWAMLASLRRSLAGVRGSADRAAEGYGDAAR